MRLVDGSPPGLAWWVRRRPSEGSVWSHFRTMWRFPDQGESDDGLRGVKGGESSSQVLCGPAGPILSEVHQPSASRDPRPLKMVEGATRHLEQTSSSRRRRFYGAHAPVS